MTRAAWEAGLYPLLTQHEKMGLRTRCRLLEVAGQGAAVRHASRRFRDRDPQSRTRGVEVAVGHAVAEHVVARHRAHASPSRADQRRLELGCAITHAGGAALPGTLVVCRDKGRPARGDRLPRAPPWSESTTYRWSMSRVGVTWPRSDSTRRHASDGRRPERGQRVAPSLASLRPAGGLPPPMENN